MEKMLHSSPMNVRPSRLNRIRILDPSDRRSSSSCSSAICIPCLNVPKQKAKNVCFFLSKISWCSLCSFLLVSSKCSCSFSLLWSELLRVILTLKAPFKQTFWISRKVRAKGFLATMPHRTHRSCYYANHFVKLGRVNHALAEHIYILFFSNGELLDTGVEWCDPRSTCPANND